MWTLVQHSGFLVGGDSGFERATEVQSVRPSDEATVLAAGGLLFDRYLTADEAKYAVNYPDDQAGAYPHVEGTFGPRIADGRPVYVPSDGDRRRVLGAVA